MPPADNVVSNGGGEKNKRPLLPPLAPLGQRPKAAVIAATTTAKVGNDNGTTKLPPSSKLPMLPPLSPLAATATVVVNGGAKAVATTTLKRKIDSSSNANDEKRSRRLVSGDDDDDAAAALSPPAVAAAITEEDAEVVVPLIGRKQFTAPAPPPPPREDAPPTAVFEIKEVQSNTVQLAPPLHVRSRAPPSSLAAAAAASSHNNNPQKTAAGGGERARTTVSSSHVLPESVYVPSDYFARRFPLNSPDETKWSEVRTFKCWHDHEMYTGYVISIPLKYSDRKGYMVWGDFCSIECMLGFVKLRREFNYSNIVTTAQQMAVEVYDVKHPIGPAPDYLLMDGYMGEGGMTIEAFRNQYHSQVRVSLRCLPFYVAPYFMLSRPKPSHPEYHIVKQLEAADHQSHTNPTVVRRFVPPPSQPAAAAAADDQKGEEGKEEDDGDDDSSSTIADRLLQRWEEENQQRSEGRSTSFLRDSTPSACGDGDDCKGEEGGGGACQVHHKYSKGDEAPQNLSQFYPSSSS